MDIIEQKDYLIMLQAQAMFPGNAPLEKGFYMVSIVLKGLYETHLNYRKPETDSKKADIVAEEDGSIAEVELIMVDREKALQLTKEFELIGADFHLAIGITPVLKKIVSDEVSIKKIEHGSVLDSIDVPFEVKEVKEILTTHIPFGEKAKA